ncbi:unnamed protein product [Ilex paraguariensis]|uniref:FHA domain-containing protein n=1 Tax=Ilex paraguariensis TaxID=185542 RepID=A0ABC8T151_9AQUA
MEIATQSLSYANLPRLPTFSSSLSPPIFHSKSSVVAYHSVTYLGFDCLPRKLKRSGRLHRQFGAIRASGGESTSTNDAERWLLEPVGDGDSRHIGFKVPMPDAFEITSSVVTVGRVPEKADLVIPVATVSAMHARIQKKEEILLVTDLDSTNGTFIDDRRRRPGVDTAASPGTCITFGDTHLAMFRVSKLENAKVSAESEGPESKAEIGDPNSESRS